ncbi:MAG: type II toxin-antitoxin system Phd/YefM family antitoxin [Dehalococcoidia bacterium]|nr:type II toxin-antitoxin system Phd/YefM family antitoxin [Dehalococcoidia bacterium]
MTTKVGLRELRGKLGHYMRRVRKGERVTVTEHGKDVAVIVPPEQTDEEKALWNMVKEGKAQWSGGKPQGMKKPVKVRGKPASQIVLEERR